ncbi:RNA dependent RNA polymerase-domain-containing protein [Mycena sp. CBHHK59/15]|nr:RNA dependent RNA polymerase-domain-containing protein [Mycena sp. CBHHK59/15]
MEDSEMTMSQVAYNRMDEEYSPEFWDAASKIDGSMPLVSTQESSGSETAVGSRETSASDVTQSGSVGEIPAEASSSCPGGTIKRGIESPTTPPRTSTNIIGTPRRPSKTLQINSSPSRSPGYKPAMAPPRALPMGDSAEHIIGMTRKRSFGEVALPPPKLQKVSHPAAQSGRRVSVCTSGSSTRPTSAAKKRCRTDPTPSRATAEAARSGPHIPEPRFSLSDVFGGRHGSHLKPYIICHSEHVQGKLDELQIARGVQWELVRGITSGLWTWDDIELKLDKLTGTNAAIAPHVRGIMLAGPLDNTPASHDMMALWRELDREAKATVENKSRGLGLMGPFEGVPDWSGGNIQCMIHLVSGRNGNDKTFTAQLDPLQMTRSHHLARELGSMSVIALRDDQKGMAIKELASRKFVFCGRVYILLPPKSSKAYMIETKENWGRRQPQSWCGGEHRISYDEYIMRNNPLDLNASQPFAKYSTRLNLFLSTSVPALEFSLENIHFIDDQYADGWTKAQKPPTEAVMTDGCGFLNLAAAQKISEKLKLERPAIAYQGRIAGSKGLWIIHPTDESPEPCIWIRDSQRKIKLHTFGRAHRIFDLLAISRPSSSVNLSTQPILILANNGVPTKVFCTLQEQGLKDLIRPLMDWRRPNATAYLWDAINNVGSVTRSRLQRLAAGSSRALGLEKRGFESADAGEDPDVDSELGELRETGRNAYNGEPVSVHEAAMDLLQAGFHPLELPYLSFKIHNVIKAAMTSFLTKYRIPLANSVDAYIIPDPTGQLQEGQVFFKSSTDPDGALQEQVVVGRYPMREPSDMQKVAAINIPALDKYVDVLVISIHGRQSLASLLAGGDTDGDEAIIIRERAIVEPFQNQPVVPPPATFLTNNFHRQVQSVTDFGHKLSEMPIAEAQCAFQQALLAGLTDDKIGSYSNYHEYATWKYGLTHEKTRRLAHMVSTLLDASKTGLRLLDDVSAADGLKYGGSRAKCFDEHSDHVQKRDRKLGPLVLDVLLTAGAVTRDELLTEFDIVGTHLRKLSAEQKPPVDLDVVGPYNRAVAAADLIAAPPTTELELLRNRGQVTYLKWCKNCGKNGGFQREEPKRRKKGPAKQTDNPKLPIMRDFHAELAEIPFLTLMGIDEIKASHAFTLHNSFGFSMAFQDICEIKRKAEMKRGPFNRVAVIDEVRNMGGLARRLLKHMGDQG